MAESAALDRNFRAVHTADEGLGCVALEEFAEPKGMAGGLVVEVRNASLSQLDVLAGEGLSKHAHREESAAIGRDFSGVVREVFDAESDLRPGDEVVGFVTRGRGVTVHVKDCPKAFELDPERRIDVDWEPDAAAPWRIKMRVHSLDRPGLLAKVTKTISKRDINIGAARITTTPDQKAVQTFDLWVNDVETLNSVMKEISKIKGVQTVERLRT